MTLPPSSVTHPKPPRLLLRCADNSPSAMSSCLPLDIIADILSRLPVKYLLRCKCVSKEWYNLASERSFIKKHLNHAVQESNPCIIFKRNFKFYYLSYDSCDERAKRLHFPYAESLENVELSGSCNGLVCISDQKCNREIFLCNPSTRAFKKLPEVVFDVPVCETSSFTTLGFGYHAPTDDYKVVRVVYLYDRPLKNMDSYQCEGRVYSLSTNSWRKINAIPFHISTRFAAAPVNGVLIWKASRGFGLRMTVLLVSFDMSTEEFQEIPYPNIGRDKNYMELGVLGGCLCVYSHYYNNRVEIWMMKEFGVSWTKQFVVQGPAISGTFRYLRPLAFLKSGEILLEKSERVLVLYDPVNERARDIKIYGIPYKFSATSVVGSLTSVSSSMDGH